MLATFLGTQAYGLAYDNVAIALMVGLPLMGLGVLVAFLGRDNRPLSRSVLPFLGMAMVALMIHVARGHSEAHFSVFAFLACLVVYRRALPILVGAVTIAIHHLSFNQFQAWGWGPMCFGEASFMRVIEHALFVVAETGVLLFLAARANAEFLAAEEIVEIAEHLVSDDGVVDLNLPPARSNDRASRKLREALAGQRDVQVVGDRFVFQSEVLFPSGSAELQTSGERQLASVAQRLLEISSKIPKEINWVLQVDGHTDDKPIKSPLYASNWELSTARAIAVVKFLNSQGIPNTNLVAAGYGEFQPLSMMDTARNRRIELKLTNR